MFLVAQLTFAPNFRVGKTKTKPMQRHILLSLLLVLPFGFLSAEDQSVDINHTPVETREDEDINDVIMHHIGDSYDWHVFDWKGHPVSVSLPVILYTKQGFVFEKLGPKNKVP
jgi:F-type H+-transporting ATPase subunit a